MPGEFAVFLDDRLLAWGDLETVTHAARQQTQGSLLMFDSATGREADFRPQDAGVADQSERDALESRPVRGRPKLGVVAREVTLLPRHWDWLAVQPGGASAALRRLVDQARRERAGDDARRQAQEAVYRVATALAGDRPGYEEAIRALFGNDLAAFTSLIVAWPPDIVAYLRVLIAPLSPPE